MIVKKNPSESLKDGSVFKVQLDNTRKNPSGGLELKRKTNPNESKYLTIGGRLDRRVHRIHHKKKTLNQLRSQGGRITNRATNPTKTIIIINK